MRQNRSFFVKMDPPNKKGSSAARPRKRATKEKEASQKREASILLRNRLLILRLAAASLIFAFVLIRTPDEWLKILLLIAASILAGFESLRDAGRALFNRYLTAEAMIVSLTVIVSFLVGFGEEGTALMILFPALKLLVTAEEENVQNQALRLLDRRSEEYKSNVELKIKKQDASDLRIATVMEDSVSMALHAGLLIALVYALILPLFFHYNIRVSVHRAITVMLVCTPFTLLAGMPSIARVSMVYAASKGTVFERASDLELMDGTKTVIMEKSCFAKSEEQRILDYQSTSLDDNTFFMLISHLAAMSGQSFAETILREWKSEIREGLITDFEEAPGGIQGMVMDSRVILGTPSYLAGYNIPAPEDPQEKGICFHLYVAGRYGGYLVLSESIQTDIGDIIHDLRVNGINRCILICEESAEEISNYSINSKFDDVYTGISSENRLNAVNEICSSDIKKKIYFTRDDEEQRSDAELEIRIGKNLGEADALTCEEDYANIPTLFSLSHRIKEIAAENAIIAFGIKALIIFFSLIGYCNLWMAILADTTAAIITILNANRVTFKSLIHSFFNK